MCIQATGEQQWCESVAVLLHYLHLVACAWLFSVGVLAYRRLTEGPCPSGQRLHCTLAWLLPATLVLVSYTVINKLNKISQVQIYMGWFFSFGTNASVLSCNNVGRCHFYRRLLTCIPSLRAHDLARPHHRSCAVTPVR